MTRRITTAGACLLLAAVVACTSARLPALPSAEAMGPWVRGSLALQGLSEGGGGGARSDLAVSLPLVLTQNIGWIATRLAGAEPAGRAAWIRGHSRDSGLLLWVLWTAAAACAAFAVGRALRGAWGWLGLLVVAIAAIGIVGTRRLEDWALAAPLAILALTTHRASLRVLLWGAVLSLTPLGFLLLACACIVGRREDRIAALLAIPLYFAFDPQRLREPIEALRGLAPALVAAGWPGFGAGRFGAELVAGWTPGAAVLGLAVCALVLAFRDRLVRLAVLATLVLWVVPAIGGSQRPDGVGLAAPLVLLAATRGAMELAVRSGRGRGGVRIAAAALLVVPVAWGTAGVLRDMGQGEARAQQVIRICAGEIGRDGLLLRDPYAPAPPESIATFTLPRHVDQPEVYDFAYWPGWYGSFTHVLLTARTLEEIVADSEARPEGAAFLAALVHHAEPVGRAGSPRFDRSAVILFRIRPGPPWQTGDLAAAWAGVPAGAREARFLADLGGFLAESGKAREAVAILRLALDWSREEPRIWCNLGTALLLLGEPQDAGAAYGEGLRRDAESIELRYGLARAYQAAGVPGRAEVELRAVLARSPRFAPAYYELARAAAAQEKWPLVVRSLEEYLACEPDPPDPDAVRIALAEARRRVESLP